jgi:poly(3-hydroxyalkanoate) synthetase
VDDKIRKKIRFAVQQGIDAMSPSNFLATNPEAQQKIIATKGESLTRGIMHMVADMRRGHISQTDENAFEVGRNVATTEGAVVFENEVMQLLQYRPLCPRASTSFTFWISSPTTPSFGMPSLRGTPCLWCRGSIPTNRTAA